MVRRPSQLGVLRKRVKKEAVLGGGIYGGEGGVSTNPL